MAITTKDSPRFNRLQLVAGCAVAILFTRIVVAILLEYRWYFPADFDSSAFLSGRQDSFIGIYRAAFYTHILSGPVAILLGAFMMVSGFMMIRGGRRKYRHLHRWAGRLLMLIVLTMVAPSGLVMSREAFAGPVAGFGFATLAIATAMSAAAALYFVRTHQFRRHQRWATRCFLLLASPLLLRLMIGATIVLRIESEWSYRLIAWLSWLIPLGIYEAWRWWPSRPRSIDIRYNSL